MLEELLERGSAHLFFVIYGALLLVAAAELALERRAPERGLLRRWGSNLALGLLTRGFVAVALPLGAMAASVWASEHGVGLLHAAPDLAGAPALLLTLLGLDLVNYAVHRLEHAVPLLWRLHRVHHSDTELDFSTSQRHHPLSALFNVVIRIASVVALGAPLAGITAYYLLRAVTDAVVHGNLRVPERLDLGLRWIFVTPGMHVVHHSADRDETDRNFGALLSIWDRLFGSYRAAPKLPYEQMRIGLEEFREVRELDLDRMLLQPVRGAGRREAPVGAT